MRWITLIVSLFLFAPASLALQEPSLNRDYETPTRLVDPTDHPNFVDDIDFENMMTAIDRQIARYKKKNLNGVLSMGGVKYPLVWAMASLEKFKELVIRTRECILKSPAKSARKFCYKMLAVDIKDNFDVFEPDLEPGDPRYGEPHTTFFTGYFTPTLEGSLKRTAEYPWAVYKRPIRRSESSSTREEIDFEGVLNNKGYELFYAKDLFEAYLLQVEGGGKVTFPGGEEKDFYLSYAGTNGQRWNFISKYMIRKGMISDGSIAAQHAYLKKHPEKQREIYATCPSYVYFKRSEQQPEGSDLVSLTNRRSIATDSKLYRFKGLLAFVETERAVRRSSNGTSTQEENKVKYRKFSRFYLDQDTGGAIKGKGRVDLYFGESEYAEYAAKVQKTYGNLYFLMLKR